MQDTGRIDQREDEIVELVAREALNEGIAARYSYRKDREELHILDPSQKQGSGSELQLACITCRKRERKQDIEKGRHNKNITLVI